MLSTTLMKGPGHLVAAYAASLCTAFGSKVLQRHQKVRGPFQGFMEAMFVPLA